MVSKEAIGENQSRKFSPVSVKSPTVQTGKSLNQLVRIPSALTEKRGGKLVPY